MCVVCSPVWRHLILAVHMPPPVASLVLASYVLLLAVPVTVVTTAAGSDPTYKSVACLQASHSILPLLLCSQLQALGCLESFLLPCLLSLLPILHKASIICWVGASAYLRLTGGSTPISDHHLMMMALLLFNSTQALLFVESLKPQEDIDIRCQQQMMHNADRACKLGDFFFEKSGDRYEDAPCHATQHMQTPVKPCKLV